MMVLNTDRGCMDNPRWYNCGKFAKVGVGWGGENVEGGEVRKEKEWIKKKNE